MNEQLTNFVIDGRSISLHPLIRNMLAMDPTGRILQVSFKLFYQHLQKLEAVIFEDQKEDEHHFSDTGNIVVSLKYL